MFKIQKTLGNYTLTEFFLNVFLRCLRSHIIGLQKFRPYVDIFNQIFGINLDRDGIREEVRNVINRIRGLKKDGEGGGGGYIEEMC